MTQLNSTSIHPWAAASPVLQSNSSYRSHAPPITLFQTYGSASLFHRKLKLPGIEVSLLRSWPQHREIFLDDLGGPSIITRVLKGRREAVKTETWSLRWSQLNSADLEGGGRGHKPWKVDSRSSRKRQGSGFSPHGFRRNRILQTPLIFSLMRQTADFRPVRPSRPVKSLNCVV